MRSGFSNPFPSFTVSGFPTSVALFHQPGELGHYMGNNRTVVMAAPCFRLRFHLPQHQSINCEDAELEIPTDGDEPRLGPDEAQVQLIVFSSFHCPGCRAFADHMRTLTERYHDKLTIRFKHYPLGTACNTDISVNRHPHSCEAAWAAEAARRQGMFWAFHDALFAASRNARNETLLQIAREIGLDVPQFEAHRHTESTKERVDSDITLGSRLGVDETPTIFVNGRRARQLSRRALQVVIEHELKQQGL